MQNQKEKKSTVARAAMRTLTPDQLGAVVGGSSAVDLNPQPLPP